MGRNTEYGLLGSRQKEGLAPSEEAEKRSSKGSFKLSLKNLWKTGKLFQARETTGLKLRIEKELSAFKDSKFWSS